MQKVLCEWEVDCTCNQAICYAVMPSACFQPLIRSTPDSESIALRQMLTLLHADTVTTDAHVIETGIYRWTLLD